MRRVLRKVVERDLDGLGDLSTMDDPTTVQEIIQGHRDLWSKQKSLWWCVFTKHAPPKMSVLLSCYFFLLTQTWGKILVLLSIWNVCEGNKLLKTEALCSWQELETHGNNVFYYDMEINILTVNIKV